MEAGAEAVSQRDVPPRDVPSEVRHDIATDPTTSDQPWLDELHFLKFFSEQIFFRNPDYGRHTQSTKGAAVTRKMDKKTLRRGYGAHQ